MISRSMVDGLFSSYSADIWSIGVSLYVLIYGRLPIQFSNLMDYMVKMKNYNSPPPLDGISSELKQLLTSLLNPDVALRPTLKGILVGWLAGLFQIDFPVDKTFWIFVSRSRFFWNVQLFLDYQGSSPLQNSSSNSNINWTSPSFLHDNDVIDYLVTLIDDVGPFFSITVRSSSAKTLTLQQFLLPLLRFDEMQRSGNKRWCAPFCASVVVCEARASAAAWR